MPTYFLHILEGHDLIADREGMIFPDLQAARDAAIAGARCIISAGAKGGILPLSHQITIQDETGQTLMSIPFADVVAIQ